MIKAGPKQTEQFVSRRIARITGKSKACRSSLIRVNSRALEQPATFGMSQTVSVLLIGLPRMRPLPRPSQPVKPVTVDINHTLKLAGSAPRVLLLEDRDDFREVLHEHLASRFFRVTSVATGVEGLREIMKGSFELIICDMMMPQVGGEMFYWAVIRARPAAGQRFIFFTGHQNNPAINFFFKRIDASVLFKPFALKALDSKMQTVLRNLR